MSNPFERYQKLRLIEFLPKIDKYPIACKELSSILRHAYDKLPKNLQAIVFQDILTAFRLLSEIQTQSAVSSAHLLVQSVEVALPKQKRNMAVKEFKHAIIDHKRRYKAQQEGKGSTQLPHDILMHIFSFLDIKSLVSVGLVCWSWNLAANESRLWELQYVVLYGNFVQEQPIRLDGERKYPLSQDPVDTRLNIDWKEAVKRAYTGGKLASNRGYCAHCKTIVWLNCSKCPNAHCGIISNIQDIKPVTACQVRKCGAAENIDQSIMGNDKKVAGILSSKFVDSMSRCQLEICCPVSMKQASQSSIVHKVTQCSPSPVLSFVEREPQDAETSHVTAVDSEHGCPESANGSTSSKTMRDVHISMRLTEDFLELAKENTEKDLETCGILGAFLAKGTLYMTTLIVPKQESTSSSCQATNEEEVFAILNERSLLPVGWIHTHPSQNCFMSSVDLHTQYSYQVMVPEAFAIVLAPKDTSRSCGLFRITEPDGMSILKGCPETGFHPHKDPDDGSPMYGQCSNVYKNSNLRFEIFDLR